MKAKMPVETNYWPAVVNSV